MAGHHGIGVRFRPLLAGSIVVLLVLGSTVQSAGAVATDDGTAYFVTGRAFVIPVNLATNTAGNSFSIPAPSQSTANPEAIAVTPNGTAAYVASTDNANSSECEKCGPDVVGASVTPINLATNSVGTPITLPANADPDAIAVTPNGTTVYVADYNEGTIIPIATATDTAGTPISVGYDPVAIAITPNGTTAYVVNDDNSEHGGTVTPVNLATRSAGHPITVGLGPVAIAIAPNGATAYVANGNDGTITPIATTTNTAGTPIKLANDANLQDIAITPNGDTAYVVAYNGTVFPINLHTNTADTPITLAVHSFPVAIAISPSGASAYVAGSGNGTVIPINLDTNTVDTPFRLPPTSRLQTVPVAIAISSTPIVPTPAPSVPNMFLAVVCVVLLGACFGIRLVMLQRRRSRDHAPKLDAQT